MNMQRTLAIMSLLPAMLLATPASAVTAKEKMETCKIGAESQELTGAKRDAFIKKCMGKGNYEPPARKAAAKPAAKKPMAAPKPAAAPSDEPAPQEKQ
jgi:hypothetical protein